MLYNRLVQKFLQSSDVYFRKHLLQSKYCLFDAIKTTNFVAIYYTCPWSLSNIIQAILIIYYGSLSLSIIINYTSGNLGL